MCNIKEVEVKPKTTQVCELCHGKVLVGEDAWTKHINSRSHRRANAKKQRLMMGEEVEERDEV
jgi:hypothetical protein